MVDLKSNLHRDQRRIVISDPAGKTYAVRTPNELWDLMWSLTTDPALKQRPSSAIARVEKVEPEVVDAEVLPSPVVRERRTQVQAIRHVDAGESFGGGRGHERDDHSRRAHEQRVPFDGFSGASPEDIVTDAVLDAGLHAGKAFVRGVQRLSFRGKVRRKGKAREIEAEIRRKRRERMGGGGQ